MPNNSYFKFVRMCQLISLLVKYSPWFLASAFANTAHIVWHEIAIIEPSTISRVGIVNWTPVTIYIGCSIICIHTDTWNNIQSTKAPISEQLLKVLIFTNVNIYLISSYNLLTLFADTTHARRCEVVIIIASTIRLMSIIICTSLTIRTRCSIVSIRTRTYVSSNTINLHFLMLLMTYIL